jgi:hypothetical protein
MGEWRYRFPGFWKKSKLGKVKKMYQILIPKID